MSVLELVARFARTGTVAAGLADLLTVALLRAGTLAEPDTFWEIRTGLVTIEQRAIPAVRPLLLDRP